jgi:hypothetical protein
MNGVLRDPFLHMIVDDWASAELCRAAVAEWPSEDWPHWLRYDGERGTKFATRDPLRLTPSCTEIVRDLLRLPVEKLIGTPGTFPDTSLYGAGMSMIPPGGELPLHLDSDHNPVTGWERALSAVVFLSECEGGQLNLWDASGQAIVKSIAHRPGRLVLFGCSDVSWHSVSTVTEGTRLSVSCFFWRFPSGRAQLRSRARFMAPSTLHSAP